MGFQRVPNTAAVTFLYNQNQEIMENTIHAERTGGYNESQIVNLAEAMDVVAASALLPIMVADASYLRVEVHGLNAENDLTAENGDSAGVGGKTGPGLPNSVTLSIKKASQFTGRSARGRWYFVGLPASDLLGNENQVDEAAVLAIVAAIEEVRQAVVTENWTPVIVSRFTSGAQRTEGATFNWISTLAVDGAVDSQRGRLA